jgi:isoleucyl-tRNA synthetase
MKISDRLRFQCFNELATVKFTPSLDEKKSYMTIAEELNGYNEWCISEKGQWGLPIPYFYLKSDPETTLQNPEITRHVADIIRQ